MSKHFSDQELGLSVAGSWVRPQTRMQIKGQQKMALAVIKLW